MKLMKKAEVNTQAQELKRQQISEGTELVQRIDALRKAHTELTEQQKQFVEKAKEELIRETTELYGQRELLKADVVSLTAIRAELQRPLDEEWKKLKDAQRIFEKKSTEVSDKDEELDAKERALEVKEARIDITIERAEKAQIEAEKREKESETMLIESENILKNSKNRREEIDAQIADRMSEAGIKENEIEFNRQGVEQLIKLNNMREKDLDERERKIDDKYKTLLRTEKRNAKQ